MGTTANRKMKIRTVVKEKVKREVSQHGWGDDEGPGRPQRKAAVSSRRQGTNEKRQFLQDGEGVVVRVGLWHRHSAEPLLWAETSTR